MTGHLYTILLSMIKTYRGTGDSLVYLGDCIENVPESPRISSQSMLWYRDMFDAFLFLKLNDRCIDLYRQTLDGKLRRAVSRVYTTTEIISKSY